MRAPNLPATISLDPTPLALTVALLLRDGSGLAALPDTPRRLEIPVADMGLEVAVTEEDWSQWWAALLDDVRSNRTRFPHSGASQALRSQIEIALAAYRPWQERLKPPGDQRLAILGQASAQVMTEGQPLKNSLYVEVLPVEDSEPVQSGGVVMLAYQRLVKLDVDECVALLRDADRRAV